MSKDRQKYNAALAAIEHVEDGEYLGVGTGSTVEYFIDCLSGAIQAHRLKIPGAVSSSAATNERLRQAGIDVVSLNDTGNLRVYVDGADEADPNLRLIKGGGAALTGEKIIAGASRRFICIVDAGKRVPILGGFPLPVEVIPMARSLVARRLTALGGQPKWRQETTTDHGNHILDVRGLDLTDTVGMEDQINAIPGVVTVGLFARRGADTLLVGTDSGVEKLTP